MAIKKGMIGANLREPAPERAPPLQAERFVVEPARLQNFA